MTSSSRIILAKELLRCARMLISAKSSGLPALGKDHNNSASIDAYVSEKYQKEFDSKCKDEIIRRGIAVKDYYNVLAQLKSIFLIATPGPIEHGRSLSYNVQDFTTNKTINGNPYKIIIKVLVPTEAQIERSKKNPDPNNGEGLCKIKWICMIKNRTNKKTRSPSRRFHKRS